MVPLLMASAKSSSTTDGPLPMFTKVEVFFIFLKNSLLQSPRVYIAFFAFHRIILIINNNSLLAGVDGIISTELINHPAPLTNAKGAYSESLGEWAVFSMLWQSKKLNNWFNLKQQASWQPSEVGMAKDLTLGIIGYGDIGVECAKHVKGAFKSKVIAMKRNPATVSKDGKSYVDELVGNDRLDYLLENCDVVVNCVPLTAETRDPFSKLLHLIYKQTMYPLNVGVLFKRIDNLLLASPQYSQLLCFTIKCSRIELFAFSYPVIK